MKMQLIFTALAAITTVLGALYQGRLCDRWSLEVSTELKEFTERLDSVPVQIGDWASIEVPVNEKEFAASHCTKVVSRAYANQLTGQQVTIFLVSGKAYHITLHTPDWCYVAAGYEMKSAPSVYSVEVPGIPEPEFFHSLFYKESATETTLLRIFWTYGLDGKWTAPKLAEHYFAGKPALYKVYFISSIEGAPTGPAADPGIAFAKDFLPVIQPILFPPASGSSGAGKNATEG